MNFLAHCGLAEDAARAWQVEPHERRGLLAGAVIGDFVKGPIPTAWPRALQAGARLHRKVDALSNVHPGIRQNCNRYPDHLRRFAPIFVDMLADHTLALSWQEYYEVPAQHFSIECYAAIAAYQQYLTPAAATFFDYMRDVDLLANYDHWPHIARGLKSVLRRLNKPDWFAQVEHASLAIVTDSHNDFHGYYPELQAAWLEWDAFEAIAAPQN
jgi:acyl carrier protein phosphodiesterase